MASQDSQIDTAKMLSDRFYYQEQLAAMRWSGSSSAPLFLSWTLFALLWRGRYQDVFIFCSAHLSLPQISRSERAYHNPKGSKRAVTVY